MPHEIEEVSADPSQHPERRDWTFIFKDPAGYPMDVGEARIIIGIAGDEVVDSGRFIHIPEEWEREHRARRGIVQVVQIACAILMVLLFLAGAVVAVIRWSRGRFNRAAFLILFGFMAILGALQLGNGFRSTTAQFVTAQPWKLQVGIILVGRPHRHHGDRRRHGAARRPHPPDAAAAASKRQPARASPPASGSAR